MYFCKLNMNNILLYISIWINCNRISDDLLYVFIGVLSDLGTVNKYVSLSVYWCLIVKVFVVHILYCGVWVII
jgi:hypothetical protein